MLNLKKNSHTGLPHGQEKLRKMTKVRKNFLKTSDFVSLNLLNSLCLKAFHW